ncbi:hypothetical protein Tco_0573736 [Tanacetum coccineum]
MSEPLPTIPTQSPFTYPIPNSSASPSFTQDDTFMPNPSASPSFTQDDTSCLNPYNQCLHHSTCCSPLKPTSTVSKKEKYEIWAMKMEYWIQNADHNLWRIVQQGNSPKRLGKDAKGNTIVSSTCSSDEHLLKTGKISPSLLRGRKFALALKTRGGLESIEVFDDLYNKLRSLKTLMSELVPELWCEIAAGLLHSFCLSLELLVLLKANLF